MSVELGSKIVVVMLFAVWPTPAWSCSPMSSAADNFRSERLRARIALARSHFVKGNFETYVAMWSARERPSFRESEEDWRKTVRKWRLFLDREKPTSELLDVQITGVRARAKMRVSVQDRDGSRVYGITYDYWVFENGDWFLDDADRSE